MLLVSGSPPRRWPAWATDGSVLSGLAARQSSNSVPGQPTAVVIIVAVAGAVLFFSLIIFLVIKSRRSSQKGAYQRTAGGDGHSGNGNSSTNRQGQQGGASNNNITTTVDRTTSIRSIMTLPVYKPRPGEGERILGREGERDGVDVIVEHSTAAEEEAMREEEMETLYQIRMTGRREREARIERRDERARARAVGDAVALAEIRSRHAAEREASALPELRLAHEQIKVRRQRAVSSVSYHDLGVARADGSRLRANSSESERIGLLSDAASIGNRPVSAQHTRERSASSIISFDSMTDVTSPGLPQSGATTPRLAAAPSGSSSDLGVTDTGEAGLFNLAPPNYEEIHLGDAGSRSSAPTYQGPPPNYPGNEHYDSHEGEFNTMSHGEGNASQRLSRGVGGAPQLPSLRVGHLPEIVIEPSTVNPQDARP